VGKPSWREALQAVRDLWVDLREAKKNLRTYMAFEDPNVEGPFGDFGKGPMGHSLQNSFKETACWGIVHDGISSLKLLVE